LDGKSAHAVGPSPKQCQFDLNLTAAPVHLVLKINCSAVDLVESVQSKSINHCLGLIPDKTSLAAERSSISVGDRHAQIFGYESSKHKAISYG